jgi:flagellar basal body-associated protein FliL
VLEAFKMKKILSIILVVGLLTLALGVGVAAASNASGPAPNMGDGVSDGSGLERPNNPGVGPAPNSGDGIPDGSGL